MGSTFFKDLCDEAESGVAQAAVPEGPYDMIVGSARPNVKSNQIFLTLDVQNGPSAGKQSDVSLYFPQDKDSRGAHVYFAKKIAGLIAYPDVKAAFQAADNAPTPEAAYQVIAESFVGKALKVELKVRNDDSAYSGSNDIVKTAPPQGLSTPAPVQDTAATTPVQVVDTGQTASAPATAVAPF